MNKEFLPKIYFPATIQYIIVELIKLISVLDIFEKKIAVIVKFSKFTSETLKKRRFENINLQNRKTYFFLCQLNIL